MENMTFNTFKEYLEEELAKALPEGTGLQFQEITKNNDTRLRTVTVSEPGDSISPTVHLDEYFKIYKKGCPISVIASEIVQIWQKYRNKVEFDTEAFMDFDMAKEHIMFRLVNYEKNRKMLEGCPHQRYLDLAVAFQYVIPDQDGAHWSAVPITDKAAQAYGTSTEELYHLAMENTLRLLGSEVLDLGGIISRAIGLDCQKAPVDMPSLYVLTNRHEFYGASIMLYPEKLREFADSQGSDLYILPSSVHELILLPVKCRDSVIQKTPEDLGRLVKTMNKDGLNPTDVLSDNVYYFDRATSEVRIA